MSAIPATTGTGAAQTAQAAGAQPAGNNTQDAFLKLLVAQLKNQDPLNPMDNSQITSQKAQISTVSGIDKLNTTLQAMATSFSAGQSLQATAMIGHSVLVPGSRLQLQNGAASGGIELPLPADKVTVSVLDGAGQVVRKVDLGSQAAGVLAFQWDGVTDSGASAAPGSYSFTVEAVQGGSKIDAVALSAGVVGGVNQGKDGVTLKVNGVGPIALSDVRQVV
jgi:flagellar basal-body rod modification protein FlgD